MRTTLVRRWNWSARKPEKTCRRPPGRQRMAGTRQKIPAGYSRKGACVNGARRPDAIKHGLFIPSDKHQMLRRKGINQFHPFLNGRNQKTVGMLVQHLPDDGPAAQQGSLAFHFRLYLFQ